MALASIALNFVGYSRLYKPFCIFWSQPELHAQMINFWKRSAK